MKNKKNFLLLIMFFSSFVMIPALYSQISPLGAQLNENPPIQSKASTSYSVQWLKNPTFNFPIEPTWYKTKSGDLSDIDPRDGFGQGNMTVIGKSGTIQFLGNPPIASQWRRSSNPDFPTLPNGGSGIDTAGAWASHTWNEATTQLGQNPAVQWRRNVTMPVNMTDYEITTASLRTIVNASVLNDVDCPGDTGSGGSGGGFQGAVFDSVRFYVVISTLNNATKYEVAYNKTTYLGRGNAPNNGGTPTTMGNTYLITVSEALLKVYLTSVLEYDHQNFTIALGITIFCEDNDATYDKDTFSMLRIKFFNLTISYAKKINQGSVMAWNQKGNQLPAINGSSQILQVDGARLQFKYRSDRNWTTDSPNSELQILINNQTYSETINLNKATRTYQDAKVGGFDVSAFIVKDTNISVGIQVYIADNFLLNRNFTVSVDDVYLRINYTIIDIPPPQPPDVDVIANTSIPFIDHWTHLTVTCQSGTSNVTQLWYQNPFSQSNITLDSNFAGVRTYGLDFMNQSAGSFLFKFWASSPEGTNYDDIMVVWLTPQSPIITLAVNSSNPFTNQWTQLMVSCQSGSANISRLWYRDPFDNTNYTLGADFEGFQIHLLNYTSASPGAHEFQFWANSTLGEDAYQALVIFWVSPLSPILSISANSTTPFTDQWANITATCQSGSRQVDTFWYYNPLLGVNTTIARNFSGSRSLTIINRSLIAGVFEYKFWANSTLGSPAYQLLIIVWIAPQPIPPLLSVSANSTTLYTVQWVNITINCQSVSGNVDTLWYYNPLTNTTTILAENFANSQTFNIINISPITGPYEYKVWANSSIGSLASHFITIVWLPPQSPTLSITANSTDPFTGQWTNISATCQSGSGNIDTFWYHNPLTGANTTLSKNFSGIRTFNIINRTLTAGTYEYKFWANTTIGSPAYQTITIIWIPPQSPILSITANITNPLTGQWTNITIICQSGSGNIDTLWYYNPLTAENKTLDRNFAGSQVFNIINKTLISGLYEYRFWANSSIGAPTFKIITILWANPQPPSINLIANTTGPYNNQWTQITVTCTPGIVRVENLWYLDPFTLTNKSIATNINESRTFFLNFTSMTQGLFEFKFWANTTLNIPAYQTISVFWTSPIPPKITVQPSSIAPYAGDKIDLVITVSSRTGNVTQVWYYNPIEDRTVLLDSNFIGIRIYTLSFISPNPALYTFTVWANSTLAAESSTNTTIQWVERPAGPDIGVIAGTMAGAIGAITAAVASYMLYFKVPKSVRMLRQLKGRILKGKPSKPFDVPRRETVADNTFSRIMKEKKLPMKKPEASSEFRKFKGKIE